MVYHYYDSPKGEDITKKLWVTSKYTGITALGIATVDVMCYSHPKTYLQTIGRYAYFLGPFLATSASFTIVSNLLASYRKKDDRLNYFLGGVASGIVVGAWRRSMMVGFLSSIGFGVLGIVKKDSIDQGWRFLPETHVVNATCKAKDYDFTLTKERPRNWTTGEN